ncbi:glycosyltransferase family 2 protein [Paracoccus sp. MBLB3053]|uniref:Glycosyltransferase family 2 protein n=1 Tax=Paracoccus aurantius TaxID=3073814 RepID=A0ABU2HQF6_9RHOB|nr:glycosyltransferase family 2 protein [Paracoccus sp. MBLB3053]MDS9467276.1 glycosyltransferase family 2 protein [Paracoccus sp. MBLB3053]
MSFQPLADFLSAPSTKVLKGPIAILLIEDGVAVGPTLTHHLKCGFKLVIALSPEPLPAHVIPEGSEGRIVNLRHDSRRSNAHVTAVNAVIEAVPANTWIYYGYNAEFLFYPFAESRTVGEMLAFHTEERRRGMLTYVIDLYAADLTRFPDAVSMNEAMLDKSGYFALGRKDRDGQHLERQLDFHGGLRWRFEEHVPADRRRIDRIALFRTEPGLKLHADHRLNVEEYNTYACPWHHNLTAAVASFRVAKALARNPGSREEIRTFAWRNSHPFRWHSQQLMDLGLIEPGQWF